MSFIRTSKAATVQPMLALLISCFALLVAPTSHADLRVLVYGDAGTGQAPQLEVAKAMATLHARTPFQLGLSLGDNWYPEGSDANTLVEIFEKPYAELIASGLVLYQTLGNHDHQEDRHLTELEYAKTHPAFGLPKPNYVITRPEVKIVVLDVANAEASVNLPPERLEWVKKQLCSKTKAPWKVLALHYQLFGTGPRGDFEALKKVLLPILDQCPPDLVLSGHEHQAELLGPRKQTWFALAGNSGAETRTQRSKSELKSHFFTLEKGFATLDFEKDRATLQFLNTRLETLFTQSLRK